MNRQRLAVVLAVAIAAVVAMPAHAQDSGGGTPFEFTVAPYLLFPTMTGDVTLRGRTVGVDLGPGEIFANLEFGLMGYFRVSKGKWGVAFDGLYMDLQKDAFIETIFGRLDLTLGLQQGMYEFTGFYEVRPWVELLFGARINDIQGGFTSPQVNVGFLESGATWVDPFVGAQFRVPDLDRWRVGARVDVGGFGLGSSFAWQVYPTAGYDFVHWFTLGGGYRVLSMNYKDGEGDEQFAYDMTIHGPFLGAVFRF
jgi:hypothetical protein